MQKYCVAIAFYKLLMYHNSQILTTLLQIGCFSTFVQFQVFYRQAKYHKQLYIGIFGVKFEALQYFLSYFNRRFHYVSRQRALLCKVGH